MTVQLTDRPAPHRAPNGGVVARRAVVRWAWRLYRRGWRAQALVVALLTVAVATAVGGASAAYNLAPVPGNAEFGTGNHRLTLEGSDPRALAADVAAARQWFGTVDAIGHRPVPVPGLADPVDFRAQQPQGAHSGPLLALREGRYPTATGEIAVTDQLAETIGLDIGTSAVLDGARRSVVGLVENPSDLYDEFALVAPPDERPASVTVLVHAATEQVRAFRAPNHGLREIASRGIGNEDVTAAVAVLGAASVALLLVSLIAAAGFVVIAHRRLRQLGLLGAIGATEKHLRLVTVANGLVVGAVAAVLGGAIGVAGWIAATPLVEPAVGQRIARFHLVWWLIGAGMALSVLTAAAAAWWPARAAARTPTVRALSGRPPSPKPAHRSAALAGVLLALGVGCLVASNQTNALLSSVGTAVTGVGVLLISPLAIRVLARAAARSPFAVRLALRDLARHQARAGTALAAVSLALAIPAAIVVTAAAAEDTAAEGNLSDRQLMIRIGSADEAVLPPDFSPFIPAKTPAEVAELQVQVERLARSLDDAVVTPLDAAVDPRVEPQPGVDGRLAITLSTPDGDGLRDLTVLYIATAATLEPYALDLDAMDPGADLLTAETGVVYLTGAAGERRAKPQELTDIRRITRRYTSTPGTFVTPDGLRRRGWQPIRTGWLVETGAPITNEQIATARDTATAAGLTIEARRDQASLAALRAGATTAGVLLALGILAMTVGLIRSEAAGDLRTLTATGATSSTRRVLTAATAGALALLGAALGILGAYLVLIAGYVAGLATLSPVPIGHLLVLALGVPLLAVITGWLLAGREPPSLAYHRLD